MPLKPGPRNPVLRYMSLLPFRSARATAGWLLIILTHSALRPASAQSGPFPSDSALRDIVQRFVIEGRSAGVVVGLIESNGTQRVAAYGTPGSGKLPLDGNSVFRIASMTRGSATMRSGA